MTRPIDPNDAPRDGSQVIFYVGDGDRENMVTAKFDSYRSEWITKDGAKFDVTTANAAHVVEEGS